MRAHWILAVACLSASLVWAVAGAGYAQDEPFFEIDAFLGLDEGDIPVYSDQPIDIWAHVGWGGHEDERYHVDNVSVHIEHLGGGDTIFDWSQIAAPSEYHYISEWFPWGILTLYGEPSNRVAITADITFTDGQGRQHGPMWSNTLVFHIIPEPGVAPLLGIALSGSVIVWRRLRGR